MDESEEEGKYQESISLNTTPLTRHHMGKHKETSLTRNPIGQFIPSR